MDALSQIHPVVLLLIALFFTFSLTSLGASVVFCFKGTHQKALDVMLGVSAGIMLAAALWSLTLPAVELANELLHNQWLPTSLGLITGGLFIVLTSLILDKKLPDQAVKKRKILFISTITLHNIPEGLAVGVGFSGFALGISGCNLFSAIMIAIGIGIQNFPDGLAVSIPLYRDGMPKSKAFFIGQTSGLVEPIAALMGYFITMAIRNILPFLLTFAAGAMIAVVMGELIPDIAKENRIPSLCGLILGFGLIMLLNLLIIV